MSQGTAINPNTPVTEVTNSASGKAELASGSQPLTFDELEQLTLAKKGRGSKAKETETTEAKEGDKDDTSKIKAEKQADFSGDPNKSQKSKASEEKETDKKSGQDKKADEPQLNKEQEQQLRKLIKAKLQDKELDLDEETLVPVKINGKEELVPVKDLMGNYSGKTAWDKKFTELSKKEKAQMSQELKLRQAADSVKQLFEEQDPDMRMFKMAQLSGLDPIQYRQKFLEDNINLLEKYYSMSEDERKADAMSFEAKFQRHRADTLDQTMKQEQSKKELSAKIDQIRASHQVTEDEFVNQYESIKELVQNGHIDKSQVTPEYVIETIQKDRIWNAVDTKMNELGVDIPQHEKGSKILNLVEHAFKLGLKPEDMGEIVQDIFSNKKAQQKVQQVQREREEFLNGSSKPVAQAKAPSSAPMFFDEM